MRPGFCLRRVGWTEGGADGGTGCIRTTVVAERAGANGGATVGLLQHARLKIGMAPGVLHQVVAAHEALVAKWAAKFLLSSVGPVVAGQLIGTGKFLTAVGPGAWEGPFTCVCP